MSKKPESKKNCKGNDKGGCRKCIDRARCPGLDTAFTFTLKDFAKSVAAEGKRIKNKRWTEKGVQ